MRQIKFRAWVHEFASFPDEKWIMDYDYRISPASNFPINALFRKDDDVILMQYTGIKDKNGVEIYEGDILRWESEYDDYSFDDYLVLWKDNGFFIKWINKKVELYEPLKNDNFKVIGNIYENPELLKGNNA